CLIANTLGDGFKMARWQTIQQPHLALGFLLSYLGINWELLPATTWRICMESIEQRVKKIVAEQLGVSEAEIKNESSLLDDLGADSLDMVELVMALEDEFETEIPDEEAEKITTVQQAVDYINANSKQ